MNTLRTMKNALFGASLIAGVTGSAVAQTPPPNPCEAAPYRAFDFWLGAWEVSTPDGKKAGENVITSEESGCLLVERWTNIQGGTGQSYNFYDPSQEKFRQVWVSKGAVIDYGGGLNDAGAMVMEGEIAYHNGTTAPFRGTWTLEEDGSVTQYFQQFNGETEKWDDWFTGIYRKKKDATE
ncbi:MAG: hypothetical protein AAGA09_02900 [Pseudomonadota bacterium]